MYSMIIGTRWAWHFHPYKYTILGGITCYNVTDILEYSHARKMVASNGTLHVTISTNINEIKVTSDGSQLRISSAI